MNSNRRRTLLTIGHSDHAMAKFIALLKLHAVSVLVDVRSRPYSRHHAQFNRETLAEALRTNGIDYKFMGDELGARRGEAACYVDGKVQYDLVVRQPAFIAGLLLLRELLEAGQVALMCAEKDPLACHRTILICRALRSDDVDIRHILGDGSCESHQELEERLLRATGRDGGSLFSDREELLDEAYRQRAAELASSRTMIPLDSPFRDDPWI